MSKKKKKKARKKVKSFPMIKLLLIIILIPICILVYSFAFTAWDNLKNSKFYQDITLQDKYKTLQTDFDMEIPEEYIPIYLSAEKKYGVPWTLLAAHHRVETRFSTMSTLVSPVGAEGPMQFMPCTFVGWNHPSCSGKGEGDISEKEKTDPKVIKKYGGYGVDANKDGVADPFNIEDAIYSAANYLSKYGASEGELKKAIYNYNHSEEYVDDILYYYKQYESVREELVQVVLNDE